MKFAKTNTLNLLLLLLLLYINLLTDVSLQLAGRPLRTAHFNYLPGSEIWRYIFYFNAGYEYCCGQWF